MTTTDLLRDVLTRDAEAAAAPDRLAALRSRLAELSAGAPTTTTPVVVTELHPSRSRRRRRTWIAAAGVAASVAAMLVVTLVVVDRPGGGRGTTPAAAVPAAASDAALPLTEYAFSVAADPGGLPFSYQGTARGVQGGVWRTSPATPAAAVLDVLTGAGENPVPARPTDAAPLGGGAPSGWTAPVTADGLDLYFSLDPADTLTVWRDDATGLWAVLVTDGLDAARVRELVASVRLGDYRAVRTPLKLSAVPAGSTLTEVSEGQGHFQLVFGPHGSQFVVGVGPAGTEGGDGATGSAPPEPLVVGSWRGSYRADDPITKVSDGRVDVIVTDGPGQAKSPGGPTSAMPLDRLTALLAGLTVADLSDPSGWTDLAAAFPR